MVTANGFLIGVVSKMRRSPYTFRQGAVKCSTHHLLISSPPQETRIKGGRMTIEHIVMGKEFVSSVIHSATYLLGQRAMLASLVRRRQATR